MKLVDLNPRWARTMYDASGVLIADAERRTGMGVTFDCPCCRRVRLSVFFANPVDGAAPAQGQKLWQRVSGETFSDLTISPSIDASAKGHWHGFITNGAIQ